MIYICININILVFVICIHIHHTYIYNMYTYNSRASHGGRLLYCNVTPQRVRAPTQVAAGSHDQRISSKVANMQDVCQGMVQRVQRTLQEVHLTLQESVGTMGTFSTESTDVDAGPAVDGSLMSPGFVSVGVTGAGLEDLSLRELIQSCEEVCVELRESVMVSDGSEVFGLSTSRRETCDLPARLSVCLCLLFVSVCLCLSVCVCLSVSVCLCLVAHVDEDVDVGVDIDVGVDT